MKRTILLVCVSLLLGTGTAIAVAWACWLPWQINVAGRVMFAANPPANGWSHATYTMHTGRGGVGDYFMLEVGGPAGSSISGAQIERAGSTVLLDFGNGPVTVDLPAWAERHRFPVGESVAHVSQGWPFLCVRASKTGQNAPLGAITIPTSEPWPRNALALIPIWKGLALNAAIYGAAWMLLIVPFVLLSPRRRWRAIKGRCVHCGYDKGDAAICPECGLATEA